MKSELAEELLDALMVWDRDAFQEKVRQLEALATYKFDEYGNFLPGGEVLREPGGLAPPVRPGRARDGPGLRPGAPRSSSPTPR